jgi:hypothetical protein
MMFQILEVEPTYGTCTICRRHDCGVMPDGTHKWIHCAALDEWSENIVIGHRCVEMFAANLGITKQVKTVEVMREPSEEELQKYLWKHIDQTVERIVEGMTRLFQQKAEKRRQSIGR